MQEQSKIDVRQKVDGIFNLDLSENKQLVNENSSIVQAIKKITEQVETRLENDQPLQKLLSELKENYEIIRDISKESTASEYLVNLSEEGSKIILELEQKILKENRNVAALLKSYFQEIRAYYLPFLPQPKTPKNTGFKQAIEKEDFTNENTFFSAATYPGQYTGDTKGKTGVKVIQEAAHNSYQVVERATALDGDAKVSQSQGFNQVEKEVNISPSPDETEGDKQVPQRSAIINQQANNIFAARDNHISLAIKNVLPRVSAEKLPRKWNVPSRNINFTGRGELLAQMTKYLSHRESKHLVLTAHGSGGIGKTQLTIEYVWQHYKDYQGICWFNAESKEQLVADYIRLGQELHLFSEDQKKVAVEERALFVKHWLEHPARAGWLLIYDSALNQDDISNLLPNEEGKILITSRHTYWPSYKTLTVSVFNLEEAQLYMKKIIGENKFDIAHANQLSEKLGRLPLALAQACAYIYRNGINISEYLNLYQKKHEIFLEENLLPKAEYQKAVAVTWNITLEQMLKESPESVELLYCCSHLHPEQIPNDLIPYFFQETPESVILLYFCTDLRYDRISGSLIPHIFENEVDIENKFKADKARRVAKEYSMLNIDEGNNALSMHILIQQIIRDQLVRERKNVDYLFKGILALIKIYPNSVGKIVDYALKKILKQHFETILKYIDMCLKTLTMETKKQLGFEWEKDILFEVLIYLIDVYDVLGDEHKKKGLLERVLVIKEKYYGKEHVEVAKILNNLGMVYGALGDAITEKKLLEHSLKIFEAHYGKDHVESAHTLHNLGNTYGALGYAIKQKELLERVLVIEEKHYGKDHQNIANVLNDLSNAYGALGDFLKQKELLELVLINDERFYGKDHLKVGKTLNNLGELYVELGDVPHGKELLEQALAIKKLYYSSDNINVVKTLHNLSKAYYALGNANKAKELLESELTIFESYYGKYHVDVATILNGLANSHVALGDTHKGKELLERALIINEKSYGKNNIKVGETLNNFGKAYLDSGDVLKGKELFKRALAIKKLHYNEENSEVAKALFNLGISYLQQKKIKKAKYYIERACAIFIKSPDCKINHFYTKKAKQTLDEINQKLLISKKEEIFSDNLFKGIFNKTEPVSANTLLESLAKKYNLADTSQSSLEKGLRNAATNNNAEDLESFIKAGCNINAQDSNPRSKKTALHWAVIKKSAPCVKKLLDNGAKFTILDINAKTAYDYAITLGDKQIISLFTKSSVLKHNTIEFSHDDLLSETPSIKFQTSNFHSLNNLFSAFIEASKQGEIEILKRLVAEHPNIVNTREDKGVKATALHWAVSSNNKELVEFLLNAGANVTLKDANGETPTQWINKDTDQHIIELLNYNLEKISTEKISQPASMELMQHGLFSGSSHSIQTQNTIRQEPLVIKLLAECKTETVNENFLNIIFTKLELAKRFSEELKNIGIESRHDQGEAKKIKPLDLCTDQERYVIQLTVDEYEALVGQANTEIDQNQAKNKTLRKMAILGKV